MKFSVFHRPKLKSLNSHGFSHELLVIFVVIGVGVAFVGHMVFSHHNTTPYTSTNQWSGFQYVPNSASAITHAQTSNLTLQFDKGTAYTASDSAMYEMVLPLSTTVSSLTMNVTYANCSRSSLFVAAGTATNKVWQVKNSDSASNKSLNVALPGKPTVIYFGISATGSEGGSTGSYLSNCYLHVNSYKLTGVTDIGGGGLTGGSNKTASTPSSTPTSTSTAAAASSSATASKTAPATASKPASTSTTKTAPTTKTTPTSTPTSTPTPSGSWWKPTASAHISWNWVIGNAPPTPYKSVNVYDIDGFDNSASTVSALHAQGSKAICYIDVGTYEPGRSDDNLIPAGDQGAAVQGWPGEKWLNIADINGLTPVVKDRMNICKSKGFDAIEPDNIDGYTNSSGFPLTAANQLAYNEFLASTAHNLGLSIGLKNDVDQTSQLQPYFDWALDEECNKYTECNTMAPFTSANKAVFNAEYTDDGETTAKFCAADGSAHINGVLFSLSLDGSTYQPCTQTW